MKPNQKQQKPEVKSPLNSGLGDLSKNEVNLIRIIRERFRYGDITIITHDGQPKKIKAVTEYDSLDTYPQPIT